MVIFQNKVWHLDPLAQGFPVQAYPRVDTAIGFVPMSNRNLIVEGDPLIRGVEEAILRIVIPITAIVVPLLEFVGWGSIVGNNPAASAICVHDGKIIMIVLACR